MNSQPRTLLHVFSTFALGGPQRRFVQLANHFGPRYRHRILAMDGTTTALAGLAENVDAKLVRVAVRPGSILANLKSFRGVLRDVMPDLLVTSNWGSIEWAAANLWLRTPHLHMEDGFGPEEAGRKFKRRNWARTLLLRRSTVVVPSLTLLKIAREQWRLPKGATIRIPNGVDCVRFQTPPDETLFSVFGLPRGIPIIGTVTTLRAEKNLHRLIDAFEKVLRQQAAFLVVVGDGPERASLQNHVAERGLTKQTVFTGSFATPEKLLGAFHLFAISSDTEQMPLSVLEAMAAGLPLVATAVGDIRDMVAEQNHPFVVDRDPNQMAQAILTLIRDPGRARALGFANARRAREHFDQKAMFSAYRDLFDGQERSQHPARNQDQVSRSHGHTTLRES
jgi:glycosyltransferase involved in cell wall biosynthesis